jgi:hypothetical protein
MVQKPRIGFEGPSYHVTADANQHQRVFKDKGDYSCYLPPWRQKTPHTVYLIFNLPGVSATKPGKEIQGGLRKR